MVKEKRVGSVFGKPLKTTYILADSLKENTTVLIPDGLDGLNAFPFISRNLKVILYEPEEVYLYGGLIELNGESKEIKGLQERIEAYDASKFIKFKNENYYTSSNTSKYNFVYVNHSLCRESNAHLTMKNKIKKLQKSVKDDGRLYIIYKIIDEPDLKTNQYLQPSEMSSYFQTGDWEIIYSNEKMEEGIGHIHVRKRTKKEKQEHVYSFNIRTAQFYIGT